MRKSASFRKLCDGLSALAETQRTHDEIMRDRNSRTWTLRRKPSRPLIFQTKPNMFDLPDLDPDGAIEVIRSGDFGKVRGLYNAISDLARGGVKVLSALVTSQEFLEQLSASIGQDFSPQVTNMLIRLVIDLFPCTGSQAQVLIDGGLCFAIMDLLEKGTPELIGSVLELIYVTTSQMAYARDAMLCLGVYEKLIQIASEIPDLTIPCCQCLKCMFGGDGPVDSEIVTNAAKSMFCLLQTESVEALCVVIDCYVAMTNKYTTLVYDLHDLGLFSLVLQFLDRYELCGPGLKLVGNLSIAQPSWTMELINQGLVDRLFGFLQTEHAADAFWVLSNLVKTIPGEMMEAINDENLDQMIAIISSSQYEIQKEATYFLASIICMSNDTEVTRFFSNEVIEVLVDMVSCGVSSIALMCLKTLLRFCKHAQTDRDVCIQLLSLFSESNLKDSLDELAESQDSMVVEAAQSLEHQCQLLSSVE